MSILEAFALEEARDLLLYGRRQSDVKAYTFNKEINTRPNFGENNPKQIIINENSSIPLKVARLFLKGQLNERNQSGGALYL